MKPRLYLALTIVLLIGLLPAAAAAVTNIQVLLQPADLYMGAYSDPDMCAIASIPACRVAEDFVVPAGGWAINNIGIWGGLTSGTTSYTDHFTVIFHRPDASGLPGETIKGFTDVPFVSQWSPRTWLAGITEYSYFLTLPQPQVLPAGTYWIEIYNDGGAGSDGYFVWESGSNDEYGSGPVGFAAFDKATQAWLPLSASTAEGVDNLSLGLISLPTMHVQDVNVDMKTGRTGSTAAGTVFIYDSADQPVNKALVTAKWTLPDGTTFTQQATTGRNGAATFRGAKDGKGTYQLCVSDVTKTDWANVPNSYACQ